MVEGGEDRVYLLYKMNVNVHSSHKEKENGRCVTINDIKKQSRRKRAVTEWSEQRKKNESTTA